MTQVSWWSQCASWAALHPEVSCTTRHCHVKCHVKPPTKSLPCLPLRMVLSHRQEAASTWKCCSAWSCSSTNLLQFVLGWEEKAAPPSSSLPVSFLQALTKKSIIENQHPRKIMNKTHMRFEQSPWSQKCLRKWPFISSAGAVLQHVHQGTPALLYKQRLLSLAP